MKGRGVLIFGLVLVLSMSFLSAGLFDFLKKKESITITGDVISEEYLDFPGNSSFNSGSEEEKYVEDGLKEKGFFGRFFEKLNPFS